MSAFFIYTAEQLAALQEESPQQQVDLFTEVKSTGLFMEDGTLKKYSPS